MMNPTGNHYNFLSHSQVTNLAKAKDFKKMLLLINWWIIDLPPPSHRYGLQNFKILN